MNTIQSRHGVLRRIDIPMPFLSSSPIPIRVAGSSIALAALAIALCGVLACTSQSDETGTLPGSGQRSGQEIFASTCAACHGVEGEGQPGWHVVKEDGTLPAPPLNGEGHTWHHGDGLLYQIVSQGGKSLEGPDIPNFKSGMPAFGDLLNDEEIVAVLTYVKSLWGDKTKRDISIRESQARASEFDPFPETGN